MTNQPTLIFITGPIGIGKSTCAVSLLNEITTPRLDFISADLYYHMYFKNNTGTEKANYSKAKRLRDYKIDKAIAQRKSFVWESVLDNEKISRIESLSKHGYFLIGVFVGTDKFDALIARVKHRADEGWYNVPEPKIMDRYFMMMNAIKRLSSISQKFVMVNSGLDGFRMVAYLDNGSIVFKDGSCLWVKRFLVNSSCKLT